MMGGCSGFKTKHPLSWSYVVRLIGGFQVVVVVVVFGTRVPASWSTAQAGTAGMANSFHTTHFLHVRHVHLVGRGIGHRVIGDVVAVG